MNRRQNGGEGFIVDVNCIQTIYNRINDKLSKQIYTDRLDYSLTNDGRFLQDMVTRTVRGRHEWREFLKLLMEKASDKNMVMFGAGIWGKILLDETYDLVQWKYAVDSNLHGKTLGSIRLLAYDEFMKKYDGEYIVISSYKNYQEMAGQLLDSGVPRERIINAGNVIYQLTEKAMYFDLTELLPCKNPEVFVDAGCCDGATTKHFFEWCGGKGYSYCLEPDMQNIAFIKKNLDGESNYEIIDKALWSRKTRLSLDARGNFATSVVETDICGKLPKVGAVALDDVLGDKKVTFIKMDIEGAETEALYGAEEIIAKQKPRLAISIYHKPEDIFTIPRLILEYNPEYKLYLRHYSFSDYDTVLYAVP